MCGAHPTCGCVNGIELAAADELLPVMASTRPAVTTGHVATDGSTVVRQDNVVVPASLGSYAHAHARRQGQGQGQGQGAGIALDDAGHEGAFTAADPQSDAVRSFAALYRRGALAGLYAAFLHGAGGAKEKQRAAALFGRLPVLSPQTLRDPNYLVDVGLWQRGPVGWNAMHAAPRYRVGQSILVEADVCADPSSPHYMCASSPAPSSGKGSGTGDGGTGDGGDAGIAAPRRSRPGEHATLRATIASIGSANVTVAVACRPVSHGGEGAAEGAAGTVLVSVPHSEVARLNNPQGAGTNAAGHTQLEDGIRCNYATPLCRAKMCETTLRLAPLAEGRQKKSGNISKVGIFLISLGSPHERPMGHTCGTNLNRIDRRSRIVSPLHCRP